MAGRGRASRRRVTRRERLARDAHLAREALLEAVREHVWREEVAYRAAVRLQRAARRCGLLDGGFLLL